MRRRRVADSRSGDLMCVCCTAYEQSGPGMMIAARRASFSCTVPQRRQLCSAGRPYAFPGTLGSVYVPVRPGETLPRRFCNHNAPRGKSNRPVAPEPPAPVAAGSARRAEREAFVRRHPAHGNRRRPHAAVPLLGGGRGAHLTAPEACLPVTMLCRL